MPPKRACDTCSVRKIQCSIPEAGPPCNWCSHQRTACTFVRKSQRRKHNSLTVEAAQELYRRIEQLEGALQSRDNVHLDPTPPQPSRGAGRCADSLSCQPSRFPDNSSNAALGSAEVLQASPGTLSNHKLPLTKSSLKWYFRGSRVLSRQGEQWLSTRIGQNIAPDTFLLLDPITSSTAILTLLDDLPVPHIPESDVSYQAVEFLVNDVFHFSFPIVERRVCQEIIHTAHALREDPGPSPVQIAAEAYVWTLHGIASLFSSQTPGLWTESDVFITRAQRLFARIPGTVDLGALECVVLLQAYYMIRGHWSSADSLHPLACRIVCRLGGHFSCYSNVSGDGSSLPISQFRRIRQLFWHCYILDKDLALSSERPPLLTRDYCDLSLPVQGSPEDARIPGDLAYRASLSVIKESVLRLLYSPQALGASEGQLLSKLRHLDAELEQWRLSIFSKMRPRLALHSDQRSLPLGVTTPEDIQRALLQLDYHYTLNHIHLSVRRCGRSDDKSSLPEDLHKVMHSSIDLSLEASRSTLLSITGLVEILKEVAWRYITYHTPVAAMSIFLNLVVHQFDSRAQSDLELLEMTARSIWTYEQQYTPEDEQETFQKLSDFVLRLSKLGHCAVRKARLEQDVSEPHEQ